MIRNKENSTYPLSEIKYLRQNISKINRRIKEHLNDEILSSFYTITPVGKYGGKKYGIKVDKKKIEIEGNI